MKDELIPVRVKCSFCFGTGLHLEGVIVDDDGNLEYYEDALGDCPKCNGKGYIEKLVKVSELCKQINK